MKQLSVKFSRFRKKAEEKRLRKTDKKRERGEEELIRSITTNYRLRLNPFRNYQFPWTWYLPLICLSQLEDFFLLIVVKGNKRKAEGKLKISPKLSRIIFIAIQIVSL